MCVCIILLKNCLGAIDGMYISACIPKDQLSMCRVVAHLT